MVIWCRIHDIISSIEGMTSKMITDAGLISECSRIRVFSTIKSWKVQTFRQSVKSQELMFVENWPCAIIIIMPRFKVHFWFQDIILIWKLTLAKLFFISFEFRTKRRNRVKITLFFKMWNEHKRIIPSIFLTHEFMFLSCQLPVTDSNFYFTTFHRIYKKRNDYFNFEANWHFIFRYTPARKGIRKTN